MLFPKHNCFPFLFLISKLMYKKISLSLLPCAGLVDITTEGFLASGACLFVCLRLSEGSHWQILMV